MTNEDKNLLLKDVCARIPYGIKAYINNYWCEEYEVRTITGVDLDESDFLIASIPGGRNSFSDIKPYLFPLSSMTEEQVEKYCQLQDRVIYNSKGFVTEDVMEYVNWCYKNHLDINDLIPKGLALDASGLNIY